MNDIYVDTSGWASLADVSEPFYEKAKEIYAAAIQNRRRLVTTNYVLAELVALMTSPMRFHRPRIVEFINGIKQSTFFDIIHIDKDFDAKSWNLLSNRADKNWSLVDCSSFVLMQENNILEALTTDHHFEQAGFVRLLK
jgi:predicted nucleic acid-binding protein